MTTTSPPQRSTRRPVAGYILASILVGVVGLVAAITLTVSGIMNSFTNVSESYEDIWETGVEVGPDTTQVELEDARYTVVTFSTEQPTNAAAAFNDQCAIVDSNGQPVSSDSSSQEITDEYRQRSPYDLSEMNYVNFTHFEARNGSYTVSCEDFGILSDGDSNTVGDNEIQGIMIGLGSVLVAGGLFFMGVVNSQRNKKAQAQDFA